MEKSLRGTNVLIVGAGNQGALADAPGSGNEHKVISFAHAFSERNASVFFCDSDTKKSVIAANIWSCSTAVRDIKLAFERNNFDIVVVTTPDESHYEILLELLLYKPSLVICEKPLCDDCVSATRIVEAYKAVNVPLLINYTRRFVPELIQLKQNYKAGMYGRLLYADVMFNRGIYHTGTHALDFMEWLREGDAEIEDNKTTFFFKYVHDLKYRVWSLHLFFEKFHWSEQRIFNDPVPSYLDYGTRYVVDNAINFLEGKEELRCTGSDALKSLRIAESMMEEEEDRNGL
jgi:predicted dehydrogenase